MKLVRCLPLALCAARVGAFQAVSFPFGVRAPAAPTRALNMVSADAPKPLEEVQDEGSGSAITDPYAAVGVTSDQLAIGVDPAEVLKWIGSKQELVDKFMRDNKGMTEERAEQEVLKFYMDAEMVNAYIKFEQDKVLNPPDLRAQAEQNLSDPKTIATYVAWLVGGASFGWVRKAVIEPKYESGEWEEIHIQLPTMPWMEKAAAESAAAASAISSAASDAAAAAPMASSVLENVPEAVVDAAVGTADAVTSTVSSVVTEGTADIIASLVQ